MPTRTTRAALAGRLVTGGAAFMVAGLIDLVVVGRRMFKSGKLRANGSARGRNR